MKQFRLWFFVLLISLGNLNAAWLDNVPTTIQQPDGKEIKCFVSGDEFYRRFHDENNYTIIQHPTSGWYVYAKNENKELVPTDLIFGKADPAKSGLKPKAMIDPELILQKSREYWENTKKPKTEKNKKNQVNNTGTIQNIVIYVRFNDETEYTDDTSSYHTMFNASSGNSMYAYYREVSYNTLSIYSTFYPRPSNNIVKSYKDNQNRNYFRPYHAQDNPTGYQTATERRTREHGLLQRAVDAVKTEIPAGLNIDNDGDTYVDNVCFIVSGTSGGWSDLLWPHMWSLWSYNVTINGKRVWTYNFQLQNFIKSNGNGVLAHEMFHSLGAPDLYHYNQDEYNPVGSWDIMANTTSTPQHMGAWMKYMYGGWIANIPEITENGAYSLNPLTSSSNNCYKIRSPNSTTQWFLVEYRKQNATFESGIPGSGLLVYRITPDSVPNGNMNGPPDEVYIYRPNGTTTNDGSFNTAFFNSTVGRVAINDATNPSSFLANGSAGGLSIHSIGSAGSTISFSIGVALNPPTLIYPANNASIVEVNPTLVWSKKSDATSYNIDIATNSNFSSIVFTRTGITDTTVAVTPVLSNGVTYYWRVRSVASGTSDWSATSIFTTILATPTLTEPTNHEYGVLLRDTLKWQAVTNANNYTLELSSISNFSSTELTQTGITSTSLIIPSNAIGHNSIYYWRVKAFKTSPATESNWSEVRDFTSILPTPVLSLPKDDSLGVLQSGTLFWASVNGANFYNLQISTNSSFSTTVVNQTNVSAPSFNFTDLEFNTEYFWRVAAGNSFQTGQWSQPFSFKTNLKYPTLLAPSNSASDANVKAELKWNDVSGGDIYHLQVATDTTMNDLVIDIDDLPGDTLYICSELDSKTKYFWRVKAFNTDGRLSDWSSIRSFTTILASPSIPFPINDASGVAVDGNLIWESIKGADSYHAQLSKSELFDNLIINDSTLTGTSKGYSDLESSVSYYWRVRSKSGTSKSDWSETWTFSTGIGQVMLSYPSLESRGIPVNGQFRWNAIPGSESYDIQLSTEPDFSTKIIDATAVTTTQYPYSALQSNVMHYWKVRAVSESGPGEWSVVWNFVTSAGEPELLSPSNNQGGMSLSDTLIWSSTSGAQTYNLIIAKDQALTDIVVQQSGLTATSYIYNFTNHFTKYYWKVNAQNNDGVSPWSEIRSFTTLIAKPQLVEPEDNIKNGGISGSLLWEYVQGASGYTLLLSDNIDFNNPIIEENGITENSYDYNDLEYNKLYYWKVIAENTDRNSDYSETRKFKTVISCPALNTPKDNSLDIKYSGQLTWNVVGGADYYKIQLSENSEFKNNTIDTSGIVFSFCNFNNLKENTKYYWRVAAFNDFSSCEWSDVWSFNTKDPIKVNDYSINGFSLTAQPNPFSNEINFIINSPYEQNGVIEIYNSIGILVSTIDNNLLNSGLNSVYWKPVNLESGIYNVVFKSSDKVLSLKVVLIK